MNLGTKTRCPVCNALLNHAQTVSNDCAPGFGDFTVCAYCDSILIFAVNEFLKASQKDLEEMHPDTKADLLKAQTAVKQLKSKDPLAFFFSVSLDGLPREEFLPEQILAVVKKLKAPRRRF